MNTVLPLTGLKVLVTRSPQQAGALSHKLQALGAEIIEVPVISIGPPPSWHELDSALARCHDYNWIVFASVNAVEYCLPRLKATNKSITDLKACRIAAIGPATAKALWDRGVQTDFVPTQFVAEGVVSEFPDYPQMSGVRILWPRTNVGRTYVADKLREAGAVVDMVQAYQTDEPDNKEELADLLVSQLRDQSINTITLASSQTTVNLHRLLNLGLERAGIKPEALESDLHSLLNDTLIASIGPETSSTARKLLGKVSVQAQSYTIDGLVEALASVR